MFSLPISYARASEIFFVFSAFSFKTSTSSACSAFSFCCMRSRLVSLATSSCSSSFKRATPACSFLSAVSSSSFSVASLRAASASSDALFRLSRHVSNSARACSTSFLRRWLSIATLDVASRSSPSSSPICSSLATSFSNRVFSCWSAALSSRERSSAFVFPSRSLRSERICDSNSATRARCAFLYALSSRVSPSSCVFSDSMSLSCLLSS
mmetsp:Transcript_32140/g.78078  ORF Transcript_32140/g.78078 Transcript_32140/m.78078 type:complete len:211 (+) Transcript_32140:1502-2134(+)